MSSTDDEPVWCQHTESGFRQRVFIMYHSTKSADSAEGILNDGFRTSKNGILGEGIYVSRDFEKSKRFGPITFRLLVNPGRMCKVDREGHKMQEEWREKFGSAWIPAICGMVPSGQEETCIKSKEQIMLLGVCRGYNLLSNPWLTNDLTNRMQSRLHQDEQQALRGFTASLGLTYQMLRNTTKGFFLTDGGHHLNPIWHQNAVDGDRTFYWTRSWDGCIENMHTGRVLTYKEEDNCLTLQKYKENGPLEKYQKWSLEGSLLISKHYDRSISDLMNNDSKGPADHYEFQRPFGQKMKKRSMYVIDIPTESQPLLGSNNHQPQQQQQQQQQQPYPNTCCGVVMSCFSSINNRLTRHSVGILYALFTLSALLGIMFFSLGYTELGLAFTGLWIPPAIFAFCREILSRINNNWCCFCRLCNHSDPIAATVTGVAALVFSITGLACLGSDLEVAIMFLAMAVAPVIGSSFVVSNMCRRG